MSVPSRQRRLLIVTGNLALLRGHYENVIAGLSKAGVHIDIRYLKDSSFPVEEYRATLESAGAPAEVRLLEKGRRDSSARLGLRLRELGNILRYAHPDYRGRHVLSDRALEKTKPVVSRWGRRIRRLGPAPAAAIARAVAWVEASLPPPRHALELIDAVRPDAVAVVPVIRTPALVDFLKAGSSRGAGTAIWVQSWDNLTNKGLLHYVPDRVFVWNESQRAELGRYHGVGPEHVCVTGAQTFDHWFDGSTPIERDEFCSQLGVDPELPIILYLASSRQIAPDEPVFFAQWLDAVRGSGDPVLETATILVRPHPTLAERWHSHRFDQRPGVVVSPATLRDRMNSDSFREQYRAELHHATLAVGINTSGLIDAAIFGKPACTVELPELRTGQGETIHFQHLKNGLLRTASSLGQHVEALAELARRDPYDRDPQSSDFVATFVRPPNLNGSPTNIFVREMSELCARRSELPAATGVQRAVGAGASALAGVVADRRRTAKRLRRAPRRALRLGRRAASPVRRPLHAAARRIASRLPAPPRRASPDDPG